MARGGMGVAGTRWGRQDDGTRPRRRIRTGPPPPPSQNLWAGMAAAAADKGRSDDAGNVDARGRRNLRFEEMDHSLTKEGNRGVGNRRRRILQPPDDEDIEDIRHAVGGRGAEGVGGGGMDRGRGNSLRQCLTLSNRAERAPKGRSSNRDWGSGEEEAAEATVAEDLSR